MHLRHRFLPLSLTMKTVLTGINPADSTPHIRLPGLKVLAAMLMLPVLAACSSQPAQRCRPGETLQFHDLLYFGTATIDSTRPAVTEAEWTRFVDEVLTHHFPEGLTVLQATGPWRSGSGTIMREGSYVLSLIHPGNPNAEESITAVIQAYKAAFDQEAVLRVRNPACVAFR